jgi:hypothetical protein
MVLPINIIDHYMVHFGLGQDIWMLEGDEIVTVTKVGGIIHAFKGSLASQVGMVACLIY